MSLAAVGPRGPGARVALALIGSHRFRGGLFLVTLALVLAVGLSFRLPDLERPGRNYDEGVYLQSLLLMRHGYLPVRDIVATQGPLHLYLAYAPYALGGYTLEAARLGAVGASLLAIVGLAWAGAATIGRIGGVAAALALALSPAFLNVSRQALPEAPALAFTILAVGAAGKAWTTDRDRWRIAAGALFAVACLVKPIVAPAGLAVVTLGVTPRSWRASALVPVVAMLVGLGALLGVGLGPALDQVVGWRLQGEQVDPSLETIRHNAELLVDRLVLEEQPAFYALALVGALLLARSRLRFGLAVVGWFVGQLGLLLLYVNLSSHLGVALLPPLALLLGAAATAAWRAIAT
ncbi:MAG: glycosyltransferase family 39 protein, partial [Chloroflexota bacterium]|nr:glycosyltransferase family 39 protein [Chloroflexota bacterium]